MGLIRNQNTLHLFFFPSDDKQRYRNVVSYDSLSKLKVLKGEGRILMRSYSISAGFLSFVPSLLF